MAKKMKKVAKKITKKGAKKPIQKKVKKKITKKKAAPSQKLVKSNKKVAKTVAKKTQKPTETASKKLNLGAPMSPLGSRVLIKKADAYEKTSGGLFIPFTAQEKPKEGEVIAVGPGAKTKAGVLKPLDVKVGDKVVYETYAGLDLRFNGQDFLILSENEIIGVVD